VSQQNSERAVLRIIREVAAEHGVRVESYGEGWILRLSKAGARGERVRFLYGYGFDLNSAATHAIACDKAATAECLAAQGIACVEHRLFLHPRMAAYVPHKGNWEGMLRFAREHRFDVVVKDNGGTGGRGVYRCRDEVQLEHAVYRLFDQTHAVAISPFYEAPVEHRFVILDGRCEVAYTKLRPTVTGDGRRTVLEILAERMTMEGAAGPVARLIASLDEAGDGEAAASGLAEVLPAGATKLLNWRHNLGQGATVRMLDVEALSASSSVLAESRALRLALDAAGALNLVFGSVDVIEVGGDAGSELSDLKSAKRSPRVLEVNSGLMMEFLARSLDGGYEIARRVYRRAFGLMFA
jgi:glutathione synthase/RimK-type ligase-like ATP-grasp enzyme